MRKVSLIGNSLAYCLNQERQRATDCCPGMTPEDVRVVSNRMSDIRDIGTRPNPHAAALPHERPVTNSLAYCLNKERQHATDYRPGMTPEDVRVVFEKSLRGERKKRGATRNDTTKEHAVRLSPHASSRTGSKLTVRPHFDSATAELLAPSV